jgi:hypothetical protein
MADERQRVTTTSDANPSPELGDAILLRLAAIADEFGAEYTSGDARSVAERVAEGRFYVACVGQFKRGKSTLINALMGASVLPVGVVPVTTVPTVIRHGDHRRARIRFQTKDWAAVPLDKLDEYVSEDQNPENAKAVTGVEVFSPARCLRRACVLSIRLASARCSPAIRPPRTILSRISMPR